MYDQTLKLGTLMHKIDTNFDVHLRSNFNRECSLTTVKDLKRGCALDGSEVIRIGGGTDVLNVTLGPRTPDTTYSSKLQVGTLLLHMDPNLEVVITYKGKKAVHPVGYFMTTPAVMGVLDQEIRNIVINTEKYNTDVRLKRITMQIFCKG